MLGVVYIVTNTVNGKQYVGQTTRPLAIRWRCHLYWANRGLGDALHRAIRKYGAKAFKIEQIDSAETSKELDEKEIYSIAQLKTLIPSGYNLTIGGVGTRGFHHTEEARWKISEAKSGRARSEETKQKLSKSLLGRRKTHCKQGHLLDDTNSYKGHRCLFCRYMYRVGKVPERLKMYAIPTNIG